MLPTYAVHFVSEPDDGGRVHAYLRDWPEVVISGDTIEQARTEVEGALGFILLTALDEGEALRVASPRQPGEEDVVLAAGVAAKAAVISAFRTSAISKSELARRLGLAETEARRILDPHHRTKLERLDAAARALGTHLIVTAA